MFQMWQEGTCNPRLQNQRNYRRTKHKKISQTTDD